MSGLEVALLGAPELRLDGAPVRFDTRKAVALIAVLAITGRRHARDELCVLLWPESDQPRARAALRRTLSSAGAVGPALVVDRGGVTLDLSATTCDVADFARCRDADDPAAATRALHLYRGDFLAGFTLRDSAEFEDWRIGVADGLRQDLDHLLGVLVTDHTRHGRLDDAIRCAQRRLALDPLREQAHQDLIRLFAWSGQRTAALRQYRTCVRILDRELGVPPLPETTSVYDDARAGRLAAPVSIVDEPPDEPAEALTSPTAQPFVGREPELSALRAAMAEAVEHPRTVAVVGETGMGASALVGRFGVEAANAGATVITVRGHEGEHDLAFAAATDLLRGVVDRRPNALAVMTSDQRTTLSHLLPAVAPPEVADRAATDSPGARSRLFSAVHAALGAVATEGAVAVVVLEDVHWFDEESRELVAFLVRRPPPGVLLVVTWHGSVTPVGVAAAVSESLRDDRAAVLRLAALDNGQVSELLTALGVTATPSDVDDVLLRTGGLPLLVTEDALSRAATSQEAPRGSRVEGMVQARLDAAGPSTGQVLAAVAVVAAPADPELLRAVSGRTEAEVVAAVEDAVARGLLVEIPERSAYDFPHETLRQMVRERTSVARRRLLHGRTADALADRLRRRPGSSSAAAIARHLDRCGREDEAATWHADAAAEALRVFAHAMAAEHLEAVLAVGHDPAATHLALGDARLRLGQYDAAIVSYEQAAALVADPLSVAEAEHRLAEVHHRLGEWDVAQTHLEAAQLLLHDVEGISAGARRSQVLADLALVSLRRGDLDVADASARAAAALASEATEPAAEAQALNVLGVVAARRGDVAGAREELNASLSLAQLVDDPAPTVAALNNLARLDAEAGDLTSAMASAERALELGLRYGDRHHAAALHANLGDLLHRAGRDDEAREHLRASAGLFADVDRDEDRRPEVWKLVEW